MRDLFAPLTDDERNELRAKIYRGAMRSYDLAQFCAPSLELWDLAHNTGLWCSELQQDLARPRPAFVPTGTGWPVAK